MLLHFFSAHYFSTSIIFIFHYLADFLDYPFRNSSFVYNPKPVAAPMAITTQAKEHQPQPSHSDATNSIFSRCQAGSVNSHTSNLSGGSDILGNDKNPLPEK
ncbi:uncharacterized protein ASPGLDRAFT_746444 [Aspergillus glaucus CBS 516.65]|uniref:Uncharacterized protein n=1 Tax=Aspergillus glaucus CBS 516.65 TaxID=1160497 RepID=A0A1L9VY59_ASPGL|nr:hypothetical protein ASPGLDRAFT_746444 [Aspergillus glaucus CBS 516.65]OJJ88807.1 hypothetical protein ASPGLDRAFT_746444 [Aspergillus glaucus CBS 516.65]